MKEVEAEKFDRLLQEARERVAHLKKNLPTEIDPVAISRVKLAFAPLASREALIWRIAELSNSACEAYGRGEIGTALLTTRAVTECAAAVWYVMEQVRDFVPANFDKADETLTKLWLGWKKDPEFPEAINVLTLLAHADKSCPGILRSYNTLSEFSHPNWSAQRLYRKIDYDTKIIHFGSFPGNASLIGLNGLVGSLGLFELAYNKIADHMPKFIENCEIAVPKEGRAGESKIPMD